MNPNRPESTRNYTNTLTYMLTLQSNYSTRTNPNQPDLPEISGQNFTRLKSGLILATRLMFGRVQFHPQPDRTRVQNPKRIFVATHVAELGHQKENDFIKLFPIDLSWYTSKIEVDSP